MTIQEMVNQSGGFTPVLYLRGLIFAAVKEVFGEKSGVSLSEIRLEHPGKENYGDYATNVALILAKRLAMKPIDIARQICEQVENYIKDHQTITLKSDSKNLPDIKIVPADILEKIYLAGPGFINLWLQTPYLITRANQLLENKESVGTAQILRGKKIAVEYTDPNPFKEFHLGHLYSNVIGESLSRLFKACGATVWRGNFYGDVGMHVAKSVWGLLAKFPASAGSRQRRDKTLQDHKHLQELRNEIKKLEQLSVSQRQKVLGQGYALGVIKFEEDKKAAEEIKQLNALIYVAAQEILKKDKGWKPIVNYRQYIEGREDRLPEIQTIYEAGLRWSLEYLETVYKRLGTKFDGYYPESWVGEYGVQLAQKGLEMGVLEKSEGTVIYRGEKDGLHTRVFVNKLGLPTYEAKDLGLAQAKYQDFPYDLSINVFGKEIDEYYKVVKSAMRKIVPELGMKANHLAHGMVKLPQGKMSSRSGNVITCEWLLDEAKKQALKIMKEVDVAEKERQSVGEAVAIGAVRYALLKGSPTNDVVFDFEKSVSFEGDSGPYLMYTYARCKSVLRKAESLKDTSDGGKLIPLSGRSSDSSEVEKSAKSLNSEELSLVRTLYRFPETVIEAARTLSPNLIASFLFDLAQKYNLFYSKHSILGMTHSQTPIINPPLGGQSSISSFRLFLTEATSVVLKQGLYLLGIKTVERM